MKTGAYRRITSQTGLLTAALVMLTGCPGDETRKPDPQRYAQMVTTFHTGVVALNVNDLQRAGPSFQEATRLFPSEPAGWANLALFHLRQRQFEPAEKALERARSLAPKNSDIRLYSAMLEIERGQAEKAVQYLREAVQLDPANLRAHALLIEQLDRLAAPGTEEEIERLYGEILRSYPTDLLSLLELARLAARDGDREKLQERLKALQAVSGGWPQQAVQRLQSIQARAATAEPRNLAPEIQVLGNLLKPTPQYQASATAHGRGGSAQVAEPIEQFLRLRQPASNPAPRDAGLSFAAEPLAEGTAPWATALLLQPAPRPPDTGAGAVPPAAAPDDAPPVIVYPKGGQVALGADGKRLLAFPGGAPASPQNVLDFDWNDDYRPDLLFAGAGGLRLYQQTAPGAWTDVTPRSGLAATAGAVTARRPAPGCSPARPGLAAAATGGSYTGAWTMDYDLDGDLDAIVGVAGQAPLALRNNGDGTWATARPFQGVTGLLDFAGADVDGDGDADAALVDAGGELSVFLNERSGYFREASLGESGGRVLAISVTDADRDGTLDLAVLREGGAVQALMHEDRNQWRSVELVRWEEAPSQGPARLLWGDPDNNGGADLVASGPEGAQVWLADEQGALQPLSAGIEARVFNLIDMNRDGRLDMVGVSPEGRPVQLVNRGTLNYHWQVLRPRNTTVREGDQKINAFGVGGEIEVRSGLLAQKQPITGPRVHFGLGEYARTDVARIIWPNGQAQGEFELAADHAPLALQRLTGSCPWLFAHDGESVKFVTDVLWKSPLGLRINAQDTAGVSQTRDWVKVRADQLASREGYYDLRLTAELWETNFFDYTSLTVVDHPAGTEVFVDERFAIPQPELKLHVTTPPVPVARATDHRGADVTEIVRERDGRYLDTFALGRYQGIAQDHHVEIELPEAARTGGPLWLLGSGWIFPTDSSINVAVSQGSQAKPEGLSIELPDGRGGWETARAGLGFPAGKYKTVLLDLTGLFPPGAARKLRLRTNMEIYWDALAVAAPAGGTEGPRVREILPETAELRYRGFSQLRQPRRSSPETPEYGALAGTGQQWLDLTGFYTRFGDVRPLLTKVDDRYVIMNAGDEIALRFPAAAPPPAGWVRDYVFVSDGWDKDGNFNTSFSTTVLPLPSHDHPEYNTPPGRLEDDPVYRRYPRDWQEYHTRYVTVEPFRTALRPRRGPRPERTGEQP